MNNDKLLLLIAMLTFQRNRISPILVRPGEDLFRTTDAAFQHVIDLCNFLINQDDEIINRSLAVFTSLVNAQEMEVLADE